MEELIQIDVGYACYGIIVKDGTVTKAPSIARWMINKEYKTIEQWVLNKNGKITKVRTGADRNGRKN